MTAAPKGTEPRTFRPVSAAVDAIVARHGEDLAHPDGVLREVAWQGLRADLRRFLDDVNLYAAVGLRELLRHAYHRANASLCAGEDGGPWLALIVEYGHLDAAADALAEAEAIVEEVRE